METAFTLMLWRASLETAPAAPDARDLFDWADLLRDAGEDAPARLLADVAAIRQGFSPQALGNREAGRPNDAPDGWTIDRGIAALEALATVFSSGLAAPPQSAVSGHADNEDGIGPVEPIGRYPGDIACGAACLRAFLADPVPSEEAAAEAVELLAQFVEADRRLPEFDYRALRDGPLDRLAAGIALAGLMDFALAVRDLVLAPTGSIALLHAVARLDQDGLGPYLSGVPRLVRNSGDLFALAARVARTAAALEAWIVLLVRECRGTLLDQIVDDLGDRALSPMLAAILDLTVSRRAVSIDAGMVARIRDAALDNADWALAAQAQARLARLLDTPDAFALLGAIHATGGDFGAAESAYLKALEVAAKRLKLSKAPDLAKDGELAENLALNAALSAVRRKDASKLIVPHGLASPPARQAVRLARRGVTARLPQRNGERINAVDVL